MSAPVFTPGGKIDTAKTLKPVKVAVLTVSDTRDEESDTSGDLLASRVTGAGHDLVARGIVKDDVEIEPNKVYRLDTQLEIGEVRETVLPDTACG